MGRQPAAVRACNEGGILTDLRLIPRWTLPIRICDFCGKANHEVKALFGSVLSSKCICSGCIGLCKQLIDPDTKLGNQ